MCYLTTRAQATGAVARLVDIQKMGTEEGALFLLRRAKYIAENALFEAAEPTDRAWAKKIALQLDGLPLALDQAGAFIEETPSSPIEYLQLYTEAGAELRRIGEPEHDSVHATFSLAFEKVGGASRAAADLLRLCAFFAPDQIPEEIFIKGAPELGENLGALATSNLHRTQIISQACSFSLLHRNAISKTLSIHRQVQAVLHDMMAEKGEEGVWAECAVRAMSRAFPNSEEFSTWPMCETMLPHALSCAHSISHFDMEFCEAALLLARSGFYLGARAQYREAEPLFERALAIREKALGPEHPNVATCLENYATSRPPVLRAKCRSQSKSQLSGALASSHQRILPAAAA
jgi:tetratricopeptide (TPR) repeat protein